MIIRNKFFLILLYARLSELTIIINYEFAEIPRSYGQTLYYIAIHTALNQVAHINVGKSPVKMLDHIR